jgi:signal transduction histidine kinase
MPIVVEKNVLGALVGFSREPFVGDEQLSTMESFANQSALSLEAATFIDRLRRINEQLAEANRVKSEFLATMSHELRTPLTAIIGFSELLLEGIMGDLTEEQKESLREVLHNAADLLDLINSLLDLTKIESGKMRLDIREIDLAGTFRRVCATMAPLIQKKNQQFTTSIPPQMQPIAGDERKLQQMLLNLLSNANKFTPEGGHINASMRYFSQNEAFREGGVEIVVVDDGIGISEDQLGRIFDMFHQVDGSSTRNFGGTGVGLALARKFVELHGGTIRVESELGKGAKFTVMLPQKRATDDQV